MVYRLSFSVPTTSVCLLTIYTMRNVFLSSYSVIMNLKDCLTFHCI